MPPTSTTMDNGGASVSMSFRGRSLLSLRRNQVVSMDQTHDQDFQELDQFQSHVADLLQSLLSDAADAAVNDHLLSWPFLDKLLDALLWCEKEFNSLLLVGAATANFLSKPPLDRAVSDLLDRAVKSLDICNAVTHALHSLRHWHRQADIAASALTNKESTLLGVAQINRARKALEKVLPPAAPADNANCNPRHHRHDSNVSSSSRSTTERNRSFGLAGTLSWGMSRNWSAAKQVQAMWTSLAAPRGIESGLALAVYTMSSVMVFAMWAMVAAFAGGAGATGTFTPPRMLVWSAPMMGLHERIVEEWRRKDKKGGAPTVGMLAEFHGVERSGRGLMELMGGGDGGTLEGLRAEEVGSKAEELAEACRRLEEGLRPFERKVREVFHRFVGSRAEVVRCLDQSSRATPLSMVL